MENWQGSAGHIEVRIGNEKIGQTYENRLTSNNMCGRYDLSTDISESKISISCNGRLSGRYLSIQKKGLRKFTVLEIKEVYYHPPPSNYYF